MFSPRSARHITVLGLLLGTLATVGTSDVVSARPASRVGPPWISIETPVNPYDASTRDAFLLVHAFHHGTPVAFPVTGTAEGIVNGDRKSIKLQFTPTSRSGAFALKKQWTDTGVWTLVITVHQEQNDVAQALVEIDRHGDVARVQVPTRPGERGIRFPRQVSSQEVEEGLRARAKLAIR